VKQMKQLRHEQLTITASSVQSSRVRQALYSALCIVSKVNMYGTTVISRHVVTVAVDFCPTAPELRRRARDPGLRVGTLGAVGAAPTDNSVDVAHSHHVLPQLQMEWYSWHYSGVNHHNCHAGN
jgi:hypothetical protein